MYDKEIDNPYMEINCPAYIDKGFAGAMSSDFDDDFLICFKKEKFINTTDFECDTGRDYL